MKMCVSIESIKLNLIVMRIIAREIDCSFTISQNFTPSACRCGIHSLLFSSVITIY